MSAQANIIPPDEPLSVLVVADRECQSAVESLGYRATLVNDSAEAEAALEREPVDIVLAGEPELLGQIKRASPRTEVILLAAARNGISAAQAKKLGAGEFLTQPFTAEELRLVLERVAHKLELVSENQVLREQIRHGGGYGEILGASPVMQKLFKLIVKVSQNQYPVLIHGESGTGKELVARSIHQSGPRSHRPFLPVDCGALVPTLMESELFGHVRGAFTGAVGSKEGLLASAQGGTVFLDEIAELPLDLQVKLLRALQEREIRPVGSNRTVKIDVRIIAATNRNLEAAVQQGSFRKDLYYRLNVVNLRLPPLRERKSDLPLLIDHFLAKCRPQGRPPVTFSEEAMRRLMAYDWPGNVRELENCIERAAALGSGPVLQSADLATSLQNAAPAPGADPAGGPEPVLPLDELERRAIFRALADTGGDKLRAARLLGIGKTTLYRKLKEYGKAIHG